MKRIIVAIDGPAASGKSTTAKLLAKKLGYIYLDTGAMYRACAYAAKEQGLDISDRAAIVNMMSTIDISVGYSEAGNIIYLGGKDISDAIRTPEMSSSASAISAIPEVRHKMVDLQRKLGCEGGIVLDGRDIGTVVFPYAQAKFFMVADVSERAKRRHAELVAKGIDTPFEQVLAELEARDLADSNRALAPLVPADDSLLVDTSMLSIEEQVNKLFEIVNLRLTLQSDNIPHKEIRLAMHSGFCFGVRRAIQLALEAKDRGKTVYTLGELIHNPQQVQELAEQGIKVAEDAKEIHDSTVVIRSHGVTKECFATLQANGNEIIDATCPYVKRTHELISNMVEGGCPVMILGNKEHQIGRASCRERV